MELRIVIRLWDGRLETVVFDGVRNYAMHVQHETPGDMDQGEGTLVMTKKRQDHMPPIEYVHYYDTVVDLVKEGKYLKAAVVYEEATGATSQDAAKTVRRIIEEVSNQHPWDRERRDADD